MCSSDLGLSEDLSSVQSLVEAPVLGRSAITSNAKLPTTPAITNKNTTHQYAAGLISPIIPATDKSAASIVAPNTVHISLKVNALTGVSSNNQLAWNVMAAAMDTIAVVFQ